MIFISTVEDDLVNSCGRRAYCIVFLHGLGQITSHTVFLFSIAFTSLLIALSLYRKLLEYLDILAWEAAKERMVRDDALQDRPPLSTQAHIDSVRKGWVFTGIAPDDWGVENMFHALLHRPVYFWKFFKLITFYLPFLITCY